MAKSSKKSKLVKELELHKRKVFYCPLCKGLLVYQSFTESKDNSFITEWICSKGHKRHFKLVE